MTPIRIRLNVPPDPHFQHLYSAPTPRHVYHTLNKLRGLFAEQWTSERGRQGKPAEGTVIAVNCYELRTGLVGSSHDDSVDAVTCGRSWVKLSERCLPLI